MLSSRKLKRYLSSISITIGLCGLAGSAHAQWQVIDLRAIIQDAQNFAQTQTHYGSQISHYAEEIKKYEEQILSLIHI